MLLTFEEAEAHECSDLKHVKQGDPAFYERVMSARRQLHAALGISDDRPSIGCRIARPEPKAQS